MAEYLTTGEFERWCMDDRDFKNRVLDKLEHISKDSATRDTEIAALKAKHGKSAKVNGAISAVVAGIVSGLGGMIFKGKL